MKTKQELLSRLQQIISDQLSVQQKEITGNSTWEELGADSLDRLGMTRAFEDEFNVEIPHETGERLNTIAETLDHLWTLVAVGREISQIGIEEVTTSEQWAEMLEVRNQVFNIEHGFSITSLPGPGDTLVWHFLARDNHGAVGTLSVVDTTRDNHIHQSYGLNFNERDRVARYAQLAILKPYRNRGIFEMLIEAAENTVICKHEFTVGWLLYPAAHARSSRITKRLNFTAQAPLLMTEFGTCHAMVRREPALQQFKPIERAMPVAV